MFFDRRQNQNKLLETIGIIVVIAAIAGHSTAKPLLRYPRAMGVIAVVVFGVVLYILKGE